MPEITYKPTSKLKLLPNNPRQIQEADFTRLCESVERNPDYFEARPIILSDRTGEEVVIAGNMRLRAAKKLGLKQVPTILLPGLTLEREAEIIIRDNISNGQWDNDVLANEWTDFPLTDWGMELPGFETQLESEIKDLSDSLKSLFNVEVSCVNEADQEATYNKLTEMGYQCRVLTL